MYDPETGKVTKPKKEKKTKIQTIIKWVGGTVVALYLLYILSLISNYFS
jgi:hypothetical protein